MTAFVVRCDLPPTELSPNHNKRSWGAKYRKGKNYREACGWVMKTAMPSEWKPGAVVVDVTYRHSKESQGYRPRDEDNARSSLKSLFDALADAGVVPHDSAKLVRWGAFKLETQKGGERDGVYLTVRRC